MDADSIDASLLEEIEAHAVYIARETGKILLEHFNQPLEIKFKGKGHKDPVTQADGLADAYLKTSIREKFPRHNILSEEGEAISEADSPFIWVLDPLDGTVNFMNGMPLFAVSVAVLWQGRPLVGSLYMPVSHRGTPGVYHARRGKGAYLDEERIDVARTPSGRPLVQFPYGYTRRFRLTGRSRKEPREARNLGSIAVEIALTACGVFQYALFGRPKIWDVAAGVLLVKEAGGLALTQGKKRRRWLPLEQFQPEPGNEETVKNLHGWSAPVIVGARDNVPQVAKDLRGPARPWRWLAGWLRP
jgi:myo-inositol-1(or 4)-monophosphatase